MATPADNWVSPHFTEADKGSNPSDDDIIVVFADRVDGWQLAIAEELLRQVEDPPAYPAMKHAGYALISVVFSYFEMIGQCVKATGSAPSPTADFVRGFRDVYPATAFTDPEIEVIYDRIRCGMFHNGYTKRGVYIDGDYTQTWDLDKANNVVKLNPHRLIRDLRAHFTSFVTRLENTANQRERANLVALFNRQPKK